MMNYDDIKVGQRVRVVAMMSDDGSPFVGREGIVHRMDPATAPYPIEVTLDGDMPVDGCEATTPFTPYELEAIETPIDWEARALRAEEDADRLYDSLVIFVSEHPDPGSEALGALHCHRQAKSQR